jgi:AP-3 complex subunit delta-1
VLVEMTKFEGTRHGKLIASQMLDVSIRVKGVRPFAIRQMVSLKFQSQSLTLSLSLSATCGSDYDDISNMSTV